MKIIETSIIIQAPADHVWRILTDLDGYVKWNPFITFARGDLVAGQPLWFSRANNMTSILNYGVVTVMNAEKHKLSWTTHWITARVLNTVYSFTIEPVELETVCFTQRETLSGFMPMFFRRSWFHTLQSYMVSKNKAIKRLAENNQHRLPKLWTTSA
jgi:hypothetical protein